MSKYILDTDHITLFQYNHPKICQRAREIGNASIFVTVVSLEEQLQRRLAIINKVTANTKKPEFLSVAYYKLRATQDFFCNVKLLDFNDAANTYYQNLRQQKVSVGIHDLRIAAIALVNQAVVVTRNKKDLSKVPNLPLENWSL
ncbi:MAG: type II toxin-antitoxin system VapC family toxin [Okeania sp. SIO3I5]|uniref:type II toxin-antitoxin system VapC family toxin n=1 Tax=Okeania sp. SIO3I5 TaxID=2607805 RepID=UPI0013B9A5E5|nr:type II toxin-antitoxin system VapC family toxin [Okeania sp. SIO3I5]NEQ40473.1 type II toxin-antitoxin system VapC family toxin [Okeania sp. SIO3I5]